jgi:hypothetical protein
MILVSECWRWVFGVLLEGHFNKKKITFINCLDFPVYLGDGELGVCGS